jgi:hypothetical protein
LKNCLLDNKIKKRRGVKNMAEEKTEEKKKQLDADDRDYRILRSIFRGLAKAGLWSKKKEDKMIARLHRLYLKAKGLFDPNKVKSEEKQSK